MYVISLKSDAVAGGAFPVPCSNEVTLHEDTEMGLGAGVTGEYLPERRWSSRTGSS